jgi:hypothetical protein
MVPKQCGCRPWPQEIKNSSKEQTFFREREKWSYATFGPRSERSAEGPLKHLRKEIGETLEALWKFQMDVGSGEALLEELVDCTFLVQDAVSRAGFTYEEFLAACWAKLEKNKRRKWGTVSSTEPVEHLREEDA